MDSREVSIKVSEGGDSQRVAISTTSAQSAAFSGSGGVDMICTPDVDCFVRQGSNPTALADGTDQMLLGGNTYRLSGIVNGNKLAFITISGSGYVYLSPGG